jgi:flagellar hook-length control protein FliK
MNTAFNMENLISRFLGISGTQEGLKGGIGEKESLREAAGHQIVFSEVMKEHMASNGKVNDEPLEKCALSARDGVKTDDGGLRKPRVGEKMDLQAFLVALAGLLDHSPGRTGKNKVLANFLKIQGFSEDDIKGIIATITGKKHVLSHESKETAIPGGKKTGESGRLRKGKGGLLAPADTRKINTGKAFHIFTSDSFTDKVQEGMKPEGSPDSRMKELPAGKTKLTEAGEKKAAAGRVASDDKVIAGLLRQSGLDEGIVDKILSRIRGSMQVPKSGKHGLKKLHSDEKTIMGARGNSPGTQEGKANLEPVKNSAFGQNEKNDVKAGALKTNSAKGQSFNETVIKVVREHESKTVLKGIQASNHSVTGDRSTVSQGTAPLSISHGGRGDFIVRPQILVNQIAEAAGGKLMKGFGRVKLQLNPPHLGTLDMDLIVRHNKVHVVLQAAHSDVGHILQSNMDQLKSALHTHGLIADTIHVSIQERSGGNQYGFGQNGTLLREGGNEEENNDNKRERRDSLTEVSSLSSLVGPNIQIEGQISVFA